MSAKLEQRLNTAASGGFDLAVRDRGENIELMFSTAFTSLIQNLETKEVKGCCG